MALVDNPLTVTLEANPNLKTTIDTKNRIGVSMLSEPINYQARAIGIQGSEGVEGAQGNEGEQGDKGDIGLVYRGLWSAIVEYSFSDAVTYEGSLFYYKSETPSINKLPTDTQYWDLIVAQGEDGPPGSSDELYAQYTKDPTGFANLTDSVMSFDNLTRQFTIRPTINGGSFTFFIEGVQFTIGTPHTLQIPDTTATYFIYYNLSGVLAFATEFPTIGIIATAMLIYWDADLQLATFIGEERHGISMDWQTHYYLHDTLGCQWSSGLDISYIQDGDGSTNDELKIALSDGVIYDEDLKHNIINGTSNNYFTQKLRPAANLPVWYRLGLNGDMKHTVPNDFPFKMAASRMEYNHFDDNTGDWLLLETANNEYCAMWIFATNEVDNPIISIMGQYTAPTLDKAMKLNSVESLNLGDSLPTPEFKMLYRIIFYAKNSYTNTFNAAIKAVTDYRTAHDKSSSGFIGLPPELTGDLHYTHTQVAVATTWYVTHELEKFPSVFVLDTNGNEVYCDIKHLDHNNVQLNFSTPFSGFAYCN